VRENHRDLNIGKHQQ